MLPDLLVAVVIASSSCLCLLFIIIVVRHGGYILDRARLILGWLTSKANPKGHQLSTKLIRPASSGHGALLARQIFPPAPRVESRCHPDQGCHGYAPLSAAYDAASFAATTMGRRRPQRLGRRWFGHQLGTTALRVGNDRTCDSTLRSSVVVAAKKEESESTQTCDGGDTVSATLIARCVSGNHFSAFMDQHGRQLGYVPDHEREGYDQRCDLAAMLTRAGQTFERAVLQRHVLPRIVAADGDDENDRVVVVAPDGEITDESLAATRHAVSSGAWLIVQAPLRGRPGGVLEGVQGICDLLVRADKVALLVDDPPDSSILEECLPPPRSAGRSGNVDNHGGECHHHYFPIDIKCTSLRVSARDGRTVQWGPHRGHAAQLAVYAALLGDSGVHADGWVPPTAFLLGRTVTRGSGARAVRHRRSDFQLGEVPTLMVDDFEDRNDDKDDDSDELLVAEGSPSRQTRQRFNAANHPHSFVPPRVWAGPQRGNAAMGVTESSSPSVPRRDVMRGMLESMPPALRWARACVSSIHPPPWRMDPSSPEVWPSARAADKDYPWEAAKKELLQSGGGDLTLLPGVGPEQRAHAQEQYGIGSVAELLGALSNENIGGGRHDSSNGDANDAAAPLTRRPSSHLTAAEILGMDPSKVATKQMSIVVEANVSTATSMTTDVTATAATRGVDARTAARAGGVASAARLPAWVVDAPVVFYVDFETVGDLYDSFEEVPEVGASPLIFMIGCGVAVKGKGWVEWECHVADRLDKASELTIIESWQRQMRDAQRRYGSGNVQSGVTNDDDEDVRPVVVHYSQAEISQLQTQYGNACDRQGIPPPDLRWFDLFQNVIKKKGQEIGLKGAYGFGLKPVAKALHAAGKIETAWEDGPADGIAAMAGAIWCGQEAERLGVRMRDLPLVTDRERERGENLMSEIETYNYVDCRVMWEIIEWLEQSQGQCEEVSSITAKFANFSLGVVVRMGERRGLLAGKLLRTNVQVPGQPSRARSRPPLAAMADMESGNNTPVGGGAADAGKTCTTHALVTATQKAIDGAIKKNTKEKAALETELAKASASITSLTAAVEAEEEGSDGWIKACNKLMRVSRGVGSLEQRLKDNEKRKGKLADEAAVFKAACAEAAAGTAGGEKISLLDGIIARLQGPHGEKLGLRFDGGAAGKKKKEQPKKKLPFRRLVGPDGLEIWAGRSSEENEDISLRVSQRGDIWMHSQGCPGSHVIVRCGECGKKPSKETMQLAADVAAFYCKKSSNKSVPVTVTYAGEVGKVRGTPMGQVKLKSVLKTMRGFPAGVPDELKRMKEESEASSK